MKFAVIGAGNAGKAVSAYLRNLGKNVTIFCRNEVLAAKLKEEGITASGAVEGHFDVTATSHLAQAVKGAQVILVQTVAAGHAFIAKELQGCLEQDQIILIFNGNWGAAEFSTILGQEACEKGVAICETGAQLFLSSSPSPTSVAIKSIKKGVAVACTKSNYVYVVADRLKEVFPQLVVGANVIETSLNNSNPVVHGPIATFNITRMENGEDYTLFGTALPRKAVDFIEKIDAERCAVAEAIGVKGICVVDILNSFWPEKKPDVYSALKENDAYKVSRGPKSIAHRYLDEDIPYGLVPIIQLGRLYDVKTPYLDALVCVLGMYLGRDYLSEGPDVEHMDLKSLIG